MDRKTETQGVGEVKAISLDVKADKEGRVEGYASRFNERDRGGDVVVPGAFAASLVRQPKLKMLWQHDPNEPIGVWDSAEEDETGLFVRGRILTSLGKGAEVAAMIGAGIIDGMSIGYRTLRATKSVDGARLLQEVELWEVSMVTFPMLESARIDAFKAAAMEKPEFERRLTQNAGFSRSVARALLGGGLEAVKAMHDAGGDGLSELARHMRQTYG